jgi:DNA-binding CsgD family transcriptional regulator
MDTDDLDGTARPRKPALPLTRREGEVLALLIRGLENKEIAWQLGIAEPSVKQYVSQLFQKFDVPNRAALAAAASRAQVTGEHGVDSHWLPQFFKHAEPHIAVLRGPDLRYEAVNESFQRATGDRPAIGRTMRETFPELEGQGIFEQVEHVLATGEPVIQHAAVRRWDTGRGIEERIVDIVLQPLRDEVGDVNGVISFALDVTDVAVPFQRAELLNEEFVALMDLMSGGAIVVDELGQIVKINDAGRRMLPLVDMDRPLATQGVDIFEVRDAAGGLLDPDSMPVARALRGETFADEIFTFNAGEPQQRRKARTSARPLRDPDGQIRGAMVVFTEL